ncbi:RHS repeat-associated core domain-containing protein [Streptomyces sp. NPDC007904]|uniref:RHS repeat-associated core domain-containing protein n=1 Tax=Streptomyces sp. NPDC007904 TaxID=3364787 RepID=UPI0036E059FE
MTRIWVTPQEGRLHLHLHLAGHISAVTAYTYDHDANGNQVATLRDGAVTHRTQWGPNAPLPVLATEYDSAWTIKQSFRYDSLGQPTSAETGTGTLFYYHHDTQGSPVDVTNSTGTLYQRWAYNPFGTRVLGTVTDGAPASPPSYTGARYETTTGNPDLHARQYDTTTGRFTRPDPATRAQTTPYISPYAYAYADNTPTLLTDPSGLTPDDPNDGESEVRRTRFPVVTSPARLDRGSAPSRQAADSDEGDLLGQFFGGFGVQAGEGVAALLAQHGFGAVEAVGGADREVLVDEGAGAAVLAGECVVQVPGADEGRLQDVDERIPEDARFLPSWARRS